MLFYKTVEIRKIPTRDKFYRIATIKTFFQYILDPTRTTYLLRALLTLECIISVVKKLVSLVRPGLQL